MGENIGRFERRTLSLGGEEFSFLHVPGPPGAPALHWAHATGFNAMTYLALFRRLARGFDVWAWDARGHGLTTALADPDSLRSWSLYYDDLCHWLDSRHRPVYLAGHSFGGTCSVVAAAMRPQKVQGLFLVDAVLLDPYLALPLQVFKRMGLMGLNPMARSAARRRRRFPSRQAIVDSYRGRGAFKTWPDEWIENYVAGGSRDLDGEVELTCAPAWEAATFSHTEHNPWPFMARVKCPIVCLTAHGGSTTVGTARRRITRLHPCAIIESIPGTSHFLPMEVPDKVAERLLAALPADSGR